MSEKDAGYKVRVMPDGSAASARTQVKLGVWLSAGRVVTTSAAVYILFTQGVGVVVLPPVNGGSARVPLLPRNAANQVPRPTTFLSTRALRTH